MPRVTQKQSFMPLPPGKACPDRQQEHQGPVPDDQEDAAASEGPLQLLHPSPPCRRVHEELPGLDQMTFYVCNSLL